MKIFINLGIVLLILLLLPSCRKPYNAPVTNADYGYLVVGV
jgi:hypothetical protein